MGQWDDGTMEQWDDGTMGKEKSPYQRRGHSSFTSIFLRGRGTLQQYNLDLNIHLYRGGHPPDNPPAGGLRPPPRPPRPGPRVVFAWP